MDNLCFYPILLLSLTKIKTQVPTFYACGLFIYFRLTQDPLGYSTNKDKQLMFPKESPNSTLSTLPRLGGIGRGLRGWLKKWFTIENYKSNLGLDLVFCESMTYMYLTIIDLQFEMIVPVCHHRSQLIGKECDVGKL